MRTQYLQHRAGKKLNGKFTSIQMEKVHSHGGGESDFGSTVVDEKAR